MQDKNKNVIIVIEFFLILIVVFIANIIKTDDKISMTERRRLSQFPSEITFGKIVDGTLIDEFEKYSTDQFILRDNFKEVKYWFNTVILRQKDNNELFIDNGSIYKMEYKIKDKSLEKTVEKLKRVNDNYLKGMNVYYSIIPDKNYYLKDDHLKMDYSKIENTLSSKLQNAKYIDIKGLLNKDDFYKTDLHWRQENISKVADEILEKMGNENNKINYEELKLDSFYGVYYGQVASKIYKDELKYLSNEELDNCITYNYETNKYGKVYDIERHKKSADKYDLFLSGPTSVITIENEKNVGKKELIMFRDSFGSSLAPLMIKDYYKITLVDLRYINSRMLSEFIEFKDQDVLFIYSGTILNQNILK